MDVCQNHSDCVVVYQGGSCPFCDCEYAAKGEIANLEDTIRRADSAYSDIEAEYVKALSLLDDLTARCPEEVAVSRLKNDTQAGSL